MTIRNIGPVLALTGLAPMAVNAGLLVADQDDDPVAIAENWFGIDLNQANPQFGTGNGPMRLTLSDFSEDGVPRDVIALLGNDGTLTLTVSSRSGMYRTASWVLTGNDRPVSVPEPGTLTLLGAGLLAMGIWGRRRHRA